jgi:hypothetical protein
MRARARPPLAFPNLSSTARCNLLCRCNKRLREAQVETLSSRQTRQLDACAAPSVAFLAATNRPLGTFLRFALRGAQAVRFSATRGASPDIIPAFGITHGFYETPFCRVRQDVSLTSVCLLPLRDSSSTAFILPWPGAGPLRGGYRSFRAFKADRRRHMQVALLRIFPCLSDRTRRAPR